MRVLMLVAMPLALIGCKERQTAHDATMAIAEDVSEDAISPLKDNVTNLEERLAALEADLRAEETYSKPLQRPPQPIPRCAVSGRSAGPTSTRWLERAFHTERVYAPEPGAAFGRDASEASCNLPANAWI
jgi:hypothetical protein